MSEQRPVEQWLAAAATHAEAGRSAEAEALYRRVLQVHPHDVRALEPLGFTLYRLGRPAEALAAFRAALATDPGLLASHTAAGYLLVELGRGSEALEHFDAAHALRPGDPEALKGRGIVLTGARRYPEAIASFERARAGAPNDPEIPYNLGNTFLACGRAPDALAAYETAIELRPQFAEALNNCGVALLALDRPEEALPCFLSALRIRPNFADALQNLGDHLSRTGRHMEAVGIYDRALAVSPDYPYTPGAALMASIACCDWSSYRQRVERVMRGLDAGERVGVPLLASLISSDANLALRAARVWVDDRFPGAAQPLWSGERYDHQRIRICYLSGDFHEHPVAYALAGVLERHDRTRFEVMGASFRSERGRSAMRARLERAFERFIDVSGRGDFEIARLLRELEVDIAIDLMGHTEDSRTGVFAFRPAPIQVNYLGYPGTLGARYMDYLVADAVVVPDAERGSYLETVVHLPVSYLPTDHRQLPEAERPTRADVALPDGGFVFCAFHNTSKITPTLFEVWMRLLRQIDGSVLWLSSRNATAVQNLRACAEQHAVRGDRLIFAPRVPRLEDHLARQALADLFLDTFPYNGHTTAVDALFAGVPVVTCRGGTMAGRAGASLLTAIGLAELVTDSLAAYEQLALALAGDSGQLAAVRRRLAANRSTASLFDTGRYCRDLEQAYLAMWTRHREPRAPS